MKKHVLSAVLALVLLAGFTEVSAQKSSGSSYTNGLGLGIDFGDGSTLVGVSGKHFFTENNVGAAEVLFGDHVVAIQAFYQYHKEIEGAAGLRWFAGIGPGVLLGNDNSAFMIRPIGGLDYKINAAPLSFSFDWRPLLAFADGDSDFTAARFGLGFRFTF